MDPENRHKYLVTIDNWGPAGWTFLHTVSFMLPLKPTRAQQNEYRKFFQLLATTLPCPVCRRHFEETLTLDPVPVTSPRVLSEWLFRVHNRVNRATGKPELGSYLDVVRQYLPPAMYDRVQVTPEERVILSRQQPNYRNPRRNPIAAVLLISGLVLLVILAVICVRRQGQTHSKIYLGR